MFLTIDDYKPVCSSNELDVLQQSDTLTRERAECAALEEVASYLRSRYDVAMTFASVGDNRNPYLVQICVNVTLFYLVQWLPRKMASANRADLYEKSIAWLKSVQGGKASPELPTLTNPDGTQTEGFPMMVGGMPRQKYDW